MASLWDGPREADSSRKTKSELSVLLGKEGKQRTGRDEARIRRVCRVEFTGKREREREGQELPERVVG